MTTKIPLLSSALDNISDNQISVNGQVYALDAILAVRRAQGEDVGAHYLDIMPNNADKGEWENTYYAMDCFEDYVMSRIEGTEYENSGFKEGSFIAKHDSNGFTLQMYGTLNNGMVIAIKAFVPESDIDYWN